MKIAGTYTIDAPRASVWEALNDIDVLARVVPGCQKLELTGENEYEGTVKIGIQSIKGTYNGRIRLTDVQPPHHYTLVANGKSSNGIVDGTGTVDLEEQGDKTLLTYGGEAKISGTLASIGQRLIEGAAKQLINQSLKALVEQIRQREQAKNGAATNGATQATSDTGTSEAASATATPDAPPTSAPNNPPPSDSFHMPTEGVSATPNVAPATSSPEPAPAGTHDPQTFAKPEQDVPPVQPPEPQQPVSPPTQAFERRAVVVPEHEQLQPGSVFTGMVQDFIGERPWLPWVIIAFLLGILIGRRGN